MPEFFIGQWPTVKGDAHASLSLLSIATVSFIALTQMASAADLPRKAPVYTPPPPPVFSWTGFYVGGDIGGARMSSQNYAFADPGNAAFDTCGNSSSLTRTKFCPAAATAQ